MMKEKEFHWVNVIPTCFQAWQQELPEWWINFEKHCIDIYDLDTRLAKSNKWRQYDINCVIDRELKPFCGKYRYRGIRSEIRFDDESWFTLFLLKWL